MKSVFVENINKKEKVVDSWAMVGAATVAAPKKCLMS